MSGPTPLLGREDELNTIRGLVAEVSAGRGGSVLVEGEPGIGRSSLLVLSRRTVQTHISHILVKLRVRSRVDIAREVFARNSRPGAHP